MSGQHHVPDDGLSFYPDTRQSPNPELACPSPLLHGRTFRRRTRPCSASRTATTRTGTRHEITARWRRGWRWTSSTRTQRGRTVEAHARRGDLAPARHLPPRRFAAPSDLAGSGPWPSFARRTLGLHLAHAQAAAPVTKWHRSTHGHQCACVMHVGKLKWTSG